MYLLESAFLSGDYEYFHLLSGQCLPIKSQDYIHSFFIKNKNKEFVDFVLPTDIKKDWYERTSLFHFFVYKSSLNYSFSFFIKSCIKVYLQCKGQ